MHTGMLKFLDRRGFGFITPDDGGPDLFVHITDLRRAKIDPHLGMRMTFESAPTTNARAKAINLKLERAPAL